MGDIVMKGSGMAPRTQLVASAATIGFFISGSAAMADVTPQQVWEDWQAYFSGFGYEVEAVTEQSGDTLSVRDLSMNMPMPEAEGNLEIVIPELGFTDNGDGTVSITMPETLPIRVMAADDEGQAFESVIEYRSSGFEMLVSGDADRMTYTYSATSSTLELTEVTADGEPVEFGTASMTMSDMAGTSVMSSGDLRELTQEFTSGEVLYALDVTDPETGGRMTAQGSYDSLGYAGTGTLPDSMNSTDMAAMLDAGFSMDGTFEVGAGSGTMSFDENGDTFKTVSTSGGGDFGVSMDAGKLSYSGATTDIEMTVETNQLPFPVQFASQKLGFEMTTPVSKGDEPQDFAGSFTLSEFTMSEAIWAMFDPAQQLPRDPATVDIDLTGKARLLFDLLDPEQAEALEDMEEAPAELNALTLNRLTVRLAGAELTGEGDFTFDNSDLESFDGLPAPLGALDLQLVGGNGLLDKLVAMGLIPQDQASGVRMMMGLFARPGDGEDTLVSRIEVNEEGHVLANGQRLK